MAGVETDQGGSGGELGEHVGHRIASARCTLPRLMRARILIVDDEEAIRSLAERALTAAGFEVICATSAAAALGLLQANEIDIVVTDVVMPEMDGFTLGAQIAVYRPHTRVVYMSGRLPAHENTAGNVLEKPFTPSELVHAVESVLAPPD